jgi:hypothetical protein
MLTKKIRYLQIAFVSVSSLVISYQYASDNNTVRARSLVDSYSRTVKNSPSANAVQAVDYGARRVQIALSEYAKGVSETTKGCNCGQDIDKYTENSPAQWCTMFASWVTSQAGSPLTDRVSQSWRIANSRLFEVALQEQGTYHLKSEILNKNLQPNVGDFIIFSRGGDDSGLGHVSIVVTVDKSVNKVDMVSGNFRDKIAYQRDYPYLQNDGFLGFGRPEKQ